MSHARASLLTVLAVSLLVAWPGQTWAAPTGIEYSENLSLRHFPPDEVAPDILEIYQGTLTFGTPNPEKLFRLIPDANEALAASEQAVSTADPYELLEFWLETEGDSLFTITPPTEGQAYINWAVTGLHWGDPDMPIVEVELTEMKVTYDGADSPRDPVTIDLDTVSLVDTDGTGVPDDPFFTSYDIPYDSSIWDDARDFHVELKVTHVPMPAAALLALPALGMIGLSRPRRRRAKGS